MNTVNSHCHKSAGTFYLFWSFAIGFFNLDSPKNHQVADLIEDAFLQLLRRWAILLNRRLGFGNLGLRGRRRRGRHDGGGRRAPGSRTGTTRSPDRCHEEAHQQQNSSFLHQDPLRLEVVGQATNDHELVQLCVNIDILGRVARPKDMTVAEGRRNGQARPNEKITASLGNDPNVGRGLAAAAKIREARFCPDDGRASHEEGHKPAKGEPFISPERVL